MSRRRVSRCNSHNDFDRHADIVSGGHFKSQARHSINTGIPRRQQGDHSTAGSTLQSNSTTFHFLAHPMRDDFLALRQITDTFQVGPISNDNAASRDRLLGTARSIQWMTRSDTDYIQHSLAIATVTPWIMLFGSINRVLLPASKAAGSATAGKFTLDATNFEWQNFFVVEAISSEGTNRRLNPSSSAAAIRPFSSFFISADANTLTWLTLACTLRNPALIAATISLLSAPLRQPIPTISVLTASVVVETTGSAPIIFAVLNARSLAPPSCPLNRLIA